LTRALTIMALTGLLVVGAAVVSIIGRFGAALPGAELASAAAQGPVANWENKTDKLAVLGVAPAGPPLAVAPVNDPMRLAFASTTADIETPSLSTPPATGLVPAVPPKPKLAGKPPPQKSYALLSDAQIAGIKDRLKLSSSQESYWPAVETALRAVARKIHETRRADPHATGAPIDPDCAEVQQLKSAAMPLLFQLREDQKREVRTLARLIGLEQVASQI
jgi:ABC-type transporter Mla MlaB component